MINYGIEDIIKEAGGVFLLDNCILTQGSFEEDLSENGYSKIDTSVFIKLNASQERVKQFISDRNVRTIHEVYLEYEQFARVVKKKYEGLNQNLKRKSSRLKTQSISEKEKENKDLLGKFYLKVSKTLKKIKKKVKKYSCSDEVLKAIKHIQEANDINYKENLYYLGTDEKLIVAALDLSSFKEPVNILTRDGKIMKTIKAMIDSYNLLKYFSDTERSNIKTAFVRAFYFDRDLNCENDLEFTYAFDNPRPKRARRLLRRRLQS